MRMIVVALALLAATPLQGQAIFTMTVDEYLALEAADQHTQCLGNPPLALPVVTVASGTAYFGPSGRFISVEVEGPFRSKWKGCFGDVALPFRHMWHVLR